MVIDQMHLHKVPLIKIEIEMSTRRGRFIFNGVRNHQEHGRFLHQANYGSGPISKREKAFKRRRIENIVNGEYDEAEVLGVASDSVVRSSSLINYEALIRLFSNDLKMIPEVSVQRIEEKILEMIRDGVPLSEEYQKFALWKGIDLSSHLEEAK